MTSIIRRVKDRAAVAIMLLAFAATAQAQFKLSAPFTQSTQAGWTLTNAAYFTAPSIDAAGSGWLRLTDAVNGERGNAQYTGGSFSSNQPLIIKFSYVSWGGSGADGLSLFLYDSTQDMSGSTVGGGLGYCGGAGGYLAIGLDEYGNFSNPGDNCGSQSGGPGPSPETLAIRGPLSSSNQYVAGAAVPSGIDDPYASTRPSPKVVLLTMFPATVGFTITAQFQSASGQPFQTLFSNVSFPYAAPATLSIGLGASTGGSTNIHEVQSLTVATPDDLQVTMTGPSTIAAGNTITYTVAVTNNGSNSIASADAPTFVDTLPVSLTGVTWSCVGSGGATCATSGSGNINTSTFTLPQNAVATFTVTGTVNPATPCNSTIQNSANADFGASSGYTDNNPVNNTASVSTTVSCIPGVIANPTALSFGSQTLGIPSAPSTITLTGTGGVSISAITSSSLDFTPTNNCSAPLSGSATCTVSVVFTPSAEGSRTGTINIKSTAASSPTISLTGTGTSAVPTPFSFTALSGVNPSSVQTSNAITVAGTNVPSPISITGGAYSINGGAYTTAPGTVSPGAQVKVQSTASASFNTATSAVLTIDGVSATFTVITGAAPPVTLIANPTALSFGSQAVGTPTAASAITLTGTGGVSIGAIASSSSDFTQTNNCSAPLSGSATCTINVVFAPSAEGSRTGTITIKSTAATSPTTISLTGTGTSAVPSPFSFTALTGVDQSSLQTSSPITVTGTNVPSPISITGGAYSINGGAYTAAPGTVSPGAQVTVQVTASAAFNTTTSAVLTIDGVSAPFSVTTRAGNPGQISFASNTYTVNNGQQWLLAVVRSGGTDGAISANIADPSGKTLATVTFAAGVGGTQSIPITLSPGYASQESLQFLNVTGGATVIAAGLTPNSNVVSDYTLVYVNANGQSGKGALNPASLLVLGFLAVLRMRRQEARSKGSN
jgi:uncharacterized repeat protein (TIGR01451 family)